MTDKKTFKGLPELGLGMAVRPIPSERIWYSPADASPLDGAPLPDRLVWRFAKERILKKIVISYDLNVTVEVK